MTIHKRFLILTSDAGFGHRSAANSISQALAALHPGEAQTCVINPILDRPSPAYLRQTEKNYDRTVLRSPDFYRFTYELSDSRPASSLVESTLTLSLYSNMRRILAEFKPNAILTTNQMFNAPMGVALAHTGQSIPFYTVVTDLADVHAMWFNPNPDRFYVATNEVKSQAVECKIPANKIIISGIPVDYRYATRSVDKAALRCSLGLKPDLLTILVVGSRRVNGIMDNLTALNHLPYAFQTVVIAGGNTALYEELQFHTWNFPIHIQNFVTNMPEWMVSADLLITKAGGLILSEGLAAGLPLILIDNLPGQEQGNVAYVTKHKAGERVENEMELLALLDSWLRDDFRRLKIVKANVVKIGRPWSAIQIADDLWNTAYMYVPKLKRSALWGGRVEHLG